MEQQKDNNAGHSKEAVAHGYSYIVRKAEKLTTALYLVTDILGDKEPLKWKARESGVDMLSDVSVAATASSSEKLSVLRGVIKKIEHVVSFLDIASSSRMITEMNASVLRREYLALRDGIEAEWSRTQERSKVLLNEHFFDVPALPKEITKEAPVEKFTPTPAPTPMHTQSTNYVPQPASPTRPAYIPPVTSHFVPTKKEIVSTPAVPPIRPIIVDREIVVRPRLDDSRDDRRKIILALLKQKPSVNVGDIAKSISGVSEKTIQRELLAMVAENILTKRGERRWSTYSIKDTY